MSDTDFLYVASLEKKIERLEEENNRLKGLLKNSVEDVEAEPVKRGLWENTNTPNQLRCSVCEIVHFIAQYPHGDINYCPNCGAKMKGESNENKD